MNTPLTWVVTTSVRVKLLCMLATLFGWGVAIGVALQPGSLVKVSSGSHIVDVAYTALAYAVSLGIGPLGLLHYSGRLAGAGARLVVRKYGGLLNRTYEPRDVTDLTLRSRGSQSRLTVRFLDRVSLTLVRYDGELERAAEWIEERRSGSASTAA